MIGAAEGQFPGYRTIESGDFEEERRLFYVAVTRAKNELYITYPRVASRPGPGGNRLRKVLRGSANRRPTTELTCLPAAISRAPEPTPEPIRRRGF